MTKVTNLSKAIEIVKFNVDARIPKTEILNTLVTELGISRSNAFVYFTKASKASGFSITVDKATVKKVSESIQGTSGTKKAQKLAEIDAFLASASSAKGNPFAALSA